MSCTSIFFSKKNVIISISILIIALSAACFSCKDSKSNKAENQSVKFLSPAEEICLPLDSLTSPRIPYFQLLREDTLKYVFYNLFSKALYVYDLEHKQLLDKILIRYAHGKLPPISAFYVLNKDSILLFPEYGPYYYITDGKGEVFPEKKSFVDADDQDKIESHWITSSAPIVKRGSKIYINNVFGMVAPEGDPHKFLLIEHDYLSGSSAFIIQHPASILEKNFDNSPIRHLKYDQQSPEGPILYSFGFDPFVYAYNGAGQEERRLYCAPPGFKEIPKMSAGLSGDDAWLVFQSQFSFSDIRFDPYRNMIIRMGLLPYRMEDMQSGKVNSEDPKRPVLLFFDANKGQFLRKANLDTSTSYIFSNAFVTERGLWMQKMTENEDLICFELFKYN